MKTTLFIFSIFSVSIIFAQTNTDVHSGSIITDSPDLIPFDTTLFELTDGRRITKAQVDSIFQLAWDNSFGKMTKEDEDLLFGDVTFIVETKIKNQEIEKRRKRKKQSQKN
jgi:hypothetical protein